MLTKVLSKSQWGRPNQTDAFKDVVTQITSRASAHNFLSGHRYTGLRKRPSWLDGVLLYIDGIA